MPTQRQLNTRSRTRTRTRTRGTMRFCGIRSVRTIRMLGVKDASPERIESWLARAEALGRRDGIRDRSNDAGPSQAIAAEAASSSVVATS